MDKKFVKLTNWYGGGAIFINRTTEGLKETIEIPADDKNSARTRVTTTNMEYLVTESAKKVVQLLS